MAPLLRHGLMVPAALWLAVAPLASASPIAPAESCVTVLDTVHTGLVPLVEFVPACVETSVEGGVTWINDDAIAHDPGSEYDGGLCFRAAFSGPALAPLAPGEAMHVTFRFEDGVLLAQTGADRVHECAEAVDETASGPGTSAIPYICYRHPNMRGLLVVRLA